MKQKHYYIEYGGGAGDICDQIFANKHKYRSINNIGEDLMTIGLICHNPFCTELFAHHPKASQLTILNPGYCYPHEYKTQKPKWGLPEHEDYPYATSCKNKDIIFYNSPQDEEILSTLPEKYILLSTEAGENHRTYPAEITKYIVKKLHPEGYIMIGVGRSYQRNDRIPQPNYPAPVIDLTDKLSFAATMNLTKHCHALITAHSALHSAGNAWQPWQLLLYPDEVRQRCKYWQGTNQGHIYTHGTFAEFNDELMDRFLEKIKVRNIPDEDK